MARLHRVILDETAGTCKLVGDELNPIAAGYTAPVGSEYTSRSDGSAWKMTTLGWVVMGSNGGRRAVSFTTPALAHGAVDVGAVTVEKAALALAVEASAVAWIRLYATAASRTSDAGRIITADPVPGQGVLLDVLPLAPNTPVILSPPILLQNADTPAAANLYYSVQNRSGSSAAITVDLTVVKLED